MCECLASSLLPALGWRGLEGCSVASFLGCFGVDRGCCCRCVGVGVVRAGLGGGCRALDFVFHNRVVCASDYFAWKYGTFECGTCEYFVVFVCAGVFFAWFVCVFGGVGWRVGGDAVVAVCAE